VRVKELADLADTTVRTVRYYHHVGLLPVPPARAGIREYDLFHLARLLRIRWLAESGLPLAAIREVLTEPGTPASGAAAEELRRALASVDARIAQLQLQRGELVRLLESAQLGRRLTPLSERATELYDRVAALMSSEGARRAVEIERSMMVFLAVHGFLPSSLDDLFIDLDATDDADTVRLFGDFAALAEASGPEADAIVRRLLDTCWSMVDRHASAVARFVTDLPRGLAGAALWATVRRLARVGFPHPAQQRFLDLFTEQFLADPRFNDEARPRDSTDRPATIGHLVRRM
jgi:DNA-binding transcriptional MerR regulator